MCGNMDVLISLGIVILMAIIPIIIYFVHGKEHFNKKRINYMREAPTNDAPALVNSICNGYTKLIGRPDINGFKATILDLVHKGYLIDFVEKEQVNKRVKNISLKINYPKLDSQNSLKNYELELIAILKAYENSNGIIEINKINSDYSKNFELKYEIWESNFTKEFLNSGEADKYFSFKGTDIIKIYGLISLIIGALAYLSRIESLIPLIFLVPIGLICIFLPVRIFGRWSEYGRAYVSEWNGFERFLQDSQIKEYSPQYIKLWDEYLIYALALNIAKQSKDSFLLFEPIGKKRKNDFWYYLGHHFKFTLKKLIFGKNSQKSKLKLSQMNFWAVSDNKNISLKDLIFNL